LVPFFCHQRPTVDVLADLSDDSSRSDARPLGTKLYDEQCRRFDAFVAQLSPRRAEDDLAFLDQRRRNRRGVALSSTTG